MEKKEYQKPHVKVVLLKNRRQLMQTSEVTRTFSVSEEETTEQW